MEIRCIDCNAAAELLAGRPGRRCCAPAPSRDRGRRLVLLTR